MERRKELNKCCCNCLYYSYRLLKCLKYQYDCEPSSVCSSFEPIPKKIQRPPDFKRQEACGNCKYLLREILFCKLDGEPTFVINICDKYEKRKL